MRRRALVPVLAAAGLACTVGVIAMARDDPQPKRPGRAELLRLQARILQQRDRLARQGIYVESTGLPARPCVAVSLANPSAPNVAYVRHRFGRDVCVEKEPTGPVQACAAYISPPVARGPVIVPDLTGLGLYEAERRAVAHGLTYSVTCLGDKRTEPRRPSILRPEALVRITAQCPRAGERVSKGAEVGLDGKAILPGGFVFPVGVLDRYHTESAHPCSDGRNP
jgi:hypothetical protein